MLLVAVTALVVVIVGAVIKAAHPLHRFVSTVNAEVVVKVPIELNLRQLRKRPLKVVAALKFRSGTVSRALQA